MNDYKEMPLLYRKVAKALGISSGKWEPIGEQNWETLPDEQVVARVWNSRNEVIIRAGDIRFFRDDVKPLL